ncbi:hypothetical protein B9Z55_003653 [Caenorhabditis nigoni]|uniref:Uncharacterized protein n=1 Tax=Caenorhabditis nigoni TaxID=1611254 RepID=A0A2G5VRW7_9PELO|nr:hypothetical protein B9Z55_003653 [Caenorhabditis nigoni]
MSSSSTPPNRKGIPLLRFPQLVRNEIFEYWDIFEIYQFSTLSKITKSISKNTKKPKTTMSLEPLEEYHQVTLKSNRGEEGNKYFKFSLCPCTEVWDKLINEYDYFRRYVNYNYHPIFAENSVETFGSLVEHVQDVFAPETEMIGFFGSSKVDEEELKSYLHWFNSYKKLGNIRRLYVYISGPAFKVFLENWKVDIGIMDARPDCSELCTVDFKVDHLITFQCDKWVDLNVLLRFDCCEASVNLNFSNQEMYLFLKDWKEGRSYHRAYCFFLGMSERAKWKKMLEGLDAELRDLRTVKRTFRFNNNRQVWDYHGGFDIKRIDGKMATVGYCDFQVTDENEPIEPYMIEEYDRVSRVWNSEDNDDEEEIEDVIVVPEGAVDEYNTEQDYIEYKKRQRNDGRCSLMMIVW